MYLYERALTQTHEFAADAGVLRQAPAAQRAYARLLSKHTLSSRNVLLVNRFFYPSLILNRIHMIYATQKTPWYRYVLIVPVFASLFLMFSCQPDEEEVTREAVAQSYDEVRSDLANIDQEIQTLVEHYYPTHQQLMEAVDKYREQNQGPVGEMILLKDKASPAVLSNLEKLIIRREELRERQMHLPDADGVYTVVENQPEPKGGIGTFYKHIGNNIRYPQEARQAGIEGKVFVQVVVDEYGQLTQAKVLKGIGGGCDEEAIRVVQEAPEWIPGTTNGQTVNVKMVIPIRFELDQIDAPESLHGNSESNGLSAAEEKSKIDEMVVVGYQ
ncbi:MAG: energy transducer TonB [Tunicatimonas sp.]